MLSESAGPEGLASARGRLHAASLALRASLLLRDELACARPSGPPAEHHVLRAGTLKLCAQASPGRASAFAPQGIRALMGIFPNTDVDFEVRRGQVVLVKGKGRTKRPTRGQIMVARMQRIAKEQPYSMTTDEVMKLMRG